MLAGIGAVGSIGKKEEGDSLPEKKTERRIRSEQAISGHPRCGDPLKIALSCKSGYNISREQENRVSPGRCLVGTFSMLVASATTIGRGSVLTAGSSCGRTLGGVSMEGALIGSFSFVLFLSEKGTGCDAGCRREDVFLPAVFVIYGPGSLCRSAALIHSSSRILYVTGGENE